MTDYSTGVNGTTTASGVTVLPNTTYLLVAEVDFPGDKIKLWVNPDLNASEPAPTVQAAYTATNFSTAVRLSSGNSSAVSVAWDDFVVATTWTFYTVSKKASKKWRGWMASLRAQLLAEGHSIP